MHGRSIKGPLTGSYPPDAPHYLQAQIGPPGPRGPPGMCTFLLY